MAQIGDRLQDGRIYAGPDYGYQSPATFKKLEKDGAFKVGASAIRRFKQAVSQRLPQPVKAAAKWYGEGEQRANQRLLDRGHSQEAIDKHYEHRGKPDATSRLLSQLSDKTNIAPELVNTATALAEAVITGRIGKSMANRSLQGLSRAPAPSAFAMGDDIKNVARLPKRASSGDPLSRARTAQTPKSAQPNTKGSSGTHQVTDKLGRVEIKNRPPGKGEATVSGAHPGNKSQQAAITEQKINQRLDRSASGQRTDAEVQALLKGDQYADAYGPAIKKFGAHPKDIAEQRAFVDADGPIPTNSGTGGRPSAIAASPVLRALKEGKRKSTGLQAVRDRLNQGRPPTTPKQSTKPIPVSAERSGRVSDALDAQQARKPARELERRIDGKGQNPIERNLLPEEVDRVRQAPSRPAEATDFSRRRAGLSKGEDRVSRRWDTNTGKTIRDKKPESTGPVKGTSVGKKGTPGVTNDQRRSGENPYISARTSKSPDSGRTNVKQPDNSGPGRTFDGTGELRGVTVKGKNTSGRSPKAVAQARSVLKQRIEKLCGLPWSADRSRRIQRMQALLKKTR